MIDDLFAFLSKIGFKEPLHPPITHMPIGLVIGAFVFLLVALFFKRTNFVITVRHVSVLAFIFAFPTILFGVIDWIHFYNAVMYTPIIIKMVLAIVLLLVLGTGIIVGSEKKFHALPMAALAFLAVACAVALGYFGSGIIYGRGLEIKKPKTTAATSHSPAAIPAGPDTSSAAENPEKAK